MYVYVRVWMCVRVCVALTQHKAADSQSGATGSAAPTTYHSTVDLLQCTALGCRFTVGLW